MSAPTPPALVRRAALLVALVALLAYANNLPNGFAMDDGYNVVDNALVRDLSNVPTFFTQPLGANADDAYSRQINSGYWRPLVLTSYALDHAVWGLDPFGFHLTNDLLHALVSALVVLLVFRLLTLTPATGPPSAPGAPGTRAAPALPFAVAAGLWFAVHPVHTEAVDLVTYRTELLATLFAALALLTLLRDPARRPRTLALVALLYAAGLASKETAVTLPGWLFLTELATRTQRPLLRRPTWALYAALALVLAGYLALRAHLLTPTDIRFFGDLEAPLVALSVASIYGEYVRLLLAPWPLTPFYDWTILPPAASLTDPLALAGLTLFLLTLAAAIVLSRRPHPSTRLAGLGLSCFLLGLLPFAHLVPLPVGAAERFLYFPSLAIALTLAAAAHRLWPALALPRRRALTTVFATTLCLYAAGTLARNPDWHSDLTLQEATARHFPHSFNARHVLGQTYLTLDRPAEALTHLTAADALLPDFPPNTHPLARALLANGRPADALSAIDRTLTLRGPDPALQALRAQLTRPD